MADNDIEFSKLIISFHVDELLDTKLLKKLKLFKLLYKSVDIEVNELYKLFHESDKEEILL